MYEQHDVIIVGAGLAGLACAIKLNRAGKQVKLVEASDRVGGRLKTDDVDGFRLDHGFIVLTTSYQNALALLDFDALRLGCYKAGARIRLEDGFHDLYDPFRHPLNALKTVVSKIGTLSDKLRILKLRNDCAKQSATPNEIRSTREFIADYGFSERFVRQFFRPFYGGILLEHALSSSANLFTFTFDRFSKGLAALPNEGIDSIPRQLMNQLPNDVIQLNTEITRIETDRVHTQSGDTLFAKHIVLATPIHITDRLLGRESTRDWKGTRCMYFSAPTPPSQDPVLMLNGLTTGLVNLVTVPSNICNGVSPKDRALISVTLKTLEADSTPDQVIAELFDWFGPEVHAWEHLKTYDIHRALPAAESKDLDLENPCIRENEFYICGDHCVLPTIDHALSSGLQAAKMLMEDHPTLMKNALSP